MFGTLKQLQDEGVFVEALQIDHAQVSRAEFPIATELADPADVKKQGIQSVPFTLVADLNAKTVLSPISGYKTAEEMRTILRQMISKRN